MFGIARPQAAYPARVRFPRWLSTRAVAAALALCGGACASAPSGGPGKPERELPIPTDLRGEIRYAEAVGRELYLLDKVAALATDTLLARVPNLREKRLGGYLPFRDAAHPQDHFTVTFFTREDPPRKAYDVHIVPEKEGELVAYDPPLPVPESFALLVRARKTAIAALTEAHQPINPVIVPGAARGEKGVLVYLIAGTRTPGTVVLGRHTRVLVPEGGGAPTYVMPLSKTEMELPLAPPDVPRGAKAVGLVVSQIVTDWPLETHVMASLQAKRPIYVVTARGTWRVDGARIAYVDDKPPATPDKR
jgi:hypothetical protein